MWRARPLGSKASRWLAAVDDLQQVLAQARVGASCGLMVLRRTEKVKHKGVPEEAR